MKKDINNLPAEADFGLNVARGLVQRASGKTLWGYNPSVSTQWETVLVPYEEAPKILEWETSAITYELYTNNEANQGVEITIEGLDELYKPISETVTLDESGNVENTANEYFRINDAYVSNGQDLVSDAHLSGNEVDQIISAEFGRLMSSRYTVPAGYTAYVTAGKISVGKGTSVIAKLMARSPGKTLLTQGIIASFGTPVEKTWTVPVALPEGTDIEIRAKAGATCEVSTAIDMVLIERNITVFLHDYAALDSALATAQAAVTSAESSLAAAEESLTLATAQAATAGDAQTAAIVALTEAQTAFDVATANLANAQAALAADPSNPVLIAAEAEAQMAFDAASVELDVANSNFIAASTQNTVAQDSLSTAQDSVSAAQVAVDEAQTAAAEAQAAVDAAAADKAAAESKLEEYK